MDKLIDIFCDVDDFCNQFLPPWKAELIADGVKKRRRQSNMSTSECMTIVIAFHQYNHRYFKSLYIGLVQKHWRGDFPKLLSYTRFLHKMSALLVPMCAYFQTVKGKPTGICNGQLKLVSRLEHRLSVRLFNRTTRTLNLTEGGHFFLNAVLKYLKM